MGVEVNEGAVKVKLVTDCTGAGFKLEAAAAVAAVVGVNMKLVAVCNGGSLKLEVAAAAVAVGAVKVKPVVACTAAGFKLATAAAVVVVIVAFVVVTVAAVAAVVVLERKLNIGFAAGTLAESFKPAPNPMFGGLADELVPMDN